ncbi:MAG: GNAT family N-acetyltransferase [Candidatus Woesearchaeota archaeon]|jgi:hypothetical protein
MNTETITDISECEKLWKKFKKENNLWTDWEIVLSFYDEKIYSPHFILLKDETLEKNKQDVGLITLWLDKRDNKYTHFGGERMENRIFWVDDKYIPELHKIIPEETYLFDLNGAYIEKILLINPELKKYISERDTRYFLNLENIKTIEEYLSRFSKKHKKNFLRDMKLLETLNYKLIWDDKNHSEKLMMLSKIRFKEASDFHDIDNQKEMNSFIELFQKKQMLSSLQIEINGKIEGVEIAAIYNNKYHVINGGFNLSIKNLGKLLIIEHIKKAIELNNSEVDFLVGDTGWKELWNLDTEECISLIKKSE